jgi:Sulfotransferase family/Phytanoyl-CoA dioxygenase (PhyH)
MQWRHTVWPEAEMVYTSIAKVANTSIKTALLETFVPNAPRRAPHAAHMPYLTVHPPSRIASQYPNYFHFAFVRDPFDRMVSFYADKILGTIRGTGWNDRLERLGFVRNMPFADAVAVACSHPDDRTDGHIRSQSFLVVDRAGRLLPDLVLRFEHLEADWALLSHLVAVKSGARLAPLIRRRVSQRQSTDVYYDDERRALLVKRYRKDFEVLAYPIAPAADTSAGVTSAGDDQLWAVVGDRTNFAMLDLSSASLSRASEVRRRSGHYLAPATMGPGGQLNSITAFTRGRLPESAFDILVVSGSQLAHPESPYLWLHNRFSATGRTVVVLPDDANSSEDARRTNSDSANVSMVPIIAPIQRAVHRYGWREALRRAPNAVERRVRAKLDKPRPPSRAPNAAGAHRPADEPATMSKLSPPDALRENGFYAIRGLLSPAESAELARSLKAELGATEGKERTSTDAVNRFDAARRLLLDDRVLHAVRAALGHGFRFLQVADLQYNHDHVHWHRDSPYRDAAGGYRRDWDESVDPYHVAKLIVYLESDNAGMGILPGTHRTQDDMDAARVRQLERAGDYTVIGADDEPNRRLSGQERDRPLAWRAGVGDALIFDERLYHCGRRVEADRVIHDQEGSKLTLSFVFGLDNSHSARMYSYFRFARKETGYKDLPDELIAELSRRGLTLSRGWGNYFEAAPEELRGAYLRDASRMDDLIHEFAGQSSG